MAVVAEAADTEHASWLAHALSRPAASADALVDFLAGATRQGLLLDPAFYGCMQQYRQVCLAAWKACHLKAVPLDSFATGRRQDWTFSSGPSSPIAHCNVQGITFDDLRGAVQRARMSTKTRVALLEDEASSPSLTAAFCILRHSEGCPISADAASSPPHHAA